VRADFVLLTDLRDFEADAAGGSTVRVTLAARLVRTRDRTIVASRDFAATAPAGMSFDGTIAGFDQALQTVLAQLSNWTLIQGNANP
jgi:cholesterol transport system auxiliary component